MPSDALILDAIQGGTRVALLPDRDGVEGVRARPAVVRITPENEVPLATKDGHVVGAGGDVISLAARPPSPGGPGYEGGAPWHRAEEGQGQPVKEIRGRTGQRDPQGAPGCPKPGDVAGPTGAKRPLTLDVVDELWSRREASGRIRCQLRGECPLDRVAEGLGRERLVRGRGEPVSGADREPCRCADPARASASRPRSPAEGASPPAAAYPGS